MSSYQMKLSFSAHNLSLIDISQWHRVMLLYIAHSHKVLPKTFVSDTDDFNMIFDLDQITECEKVLSQITRFPTENYGTRDYEPMAIGFYLNRFPWLLFVLESYDRDRIRRGTDPENKELSLQEWMKECDFLNEYLLQELGNKSLFDAIERVCVFYIRKWKNEFRLLPHKLEIERMYIEDDLYEMTDIILGVYTFVRKLAAEYTNGTKFQCEFCVGVRSTKKLVCRSAL